MRIYLDFIIQCRCTHMQPPVEPSNPRIHKLTGTRRNVLFIYTYIDYIYNITYSNVTLERETDNLLEGPED